GNAESDKPPSTEERSGRESVYISRVSSGDEPGSSGTRPEGVSKAALLDGKDLKAATAELRPFLVSARTRMQRYLNPDGTLKDAQSHSTPGTSSVQEAQELLLAQAPQSSDERRQKMLETAKVVDTTLFRAYMFASPSLAGPLFRLDNFCDPDVVKEKLIETERYNDLVDFLYGKKLHEQALDLLERLGKDDKKSESASQLTGPRRTVAYLQGLPPEMIDLILRYVEWPLIEDPDLAMEVFLADSENAESLPRQRVLDFLRKKDKGLSVRYLKHIIGELDDSTPQFHQELVDTYVQGLKKRKFSDELARHEWETDTLGFLR
ncbi:MAG: hypothetical protein Q9174_007472, partial [Haloplaca sp. 1 TL-2023]